MLTSRRSQISASDKLDEFPCAEMGTFFAQALIRSALYGEHGAIVHYSSTPETNIQVKEGSLLLMDTGAGFYEGSTDGPEPMHWVRFRST